MKFSSFFRCYGLKKREAMNKKDMKQFIEIEITIKKTWARFFLFFFVNSSSTAISERVSHMARCKSLCSAVFSLSSFAMVTICMLMMLLSGDELVKKREKKSLKIDIFFYHRRFHVLFIYSNLDKSIFSCCFIVPCFWLNFLSIAVTKLGDEQS